MAEHSSGEIVGTFLVGTIIGGIAALLLAPASGRETREKIGEWMEENKDAAQKNMGEAKDAAWQRMNEAKETAKQKMGEMKDAAQKKIEELEAELKRRKEELAAEIRRRKAARTAQKTASSEQTDKKDQTIVEDAEEVISEEEAQA